ncbi:MAG: LptF/LptG family permease [Bacteroidaceae bacterium]|nr:LptF/LptG family permease [Bacteroidaceae bacterium]
MRFIKKLDMFILKTYLLLFAGTFFICLFIFLMQYTWQHVEKLIGKGLSWDVLAKFFYYSGLTLVPMSLPLAILLASLISFGNLGEKFELLSMKAAGIPLVRILRPVLCFVLVVCGASFYFQNKVLPEATKQLATLIWSMKQKSPELEIPEGIFYSEIPNYNLFVEHKDPKTGVLYGVMIYNNTGNADETQIVLADSARLQSTADKMHLKLTLYNGERFRNMDTRNGNMLRAEVPYMRESFINEVDLIPFDGNFNMMDANLFAGHAKTKELRGIIAGIDSLRHLTDSIGHFVAKEALTRYIDKSIPEGVEDSARIVADEAESRLTIDSIYDRLTNEQRTSAWKVAVSRAQAMESNYDFHGVIAADNNLTLRQHQIAANQKFTLSLACLLFFFIGAPLGAIIRKGGLGVPVVISVLIFIFYYMVNVGSEKMAKTGTWNITSGVWLSSAVLLPIGLFLINRANKDSVVFNIEAYRNFFYRLLGLRAHRRLAPKEVVIDNPDYPALSEELERLVGECNNYVQTNSLRRMPDYIRIFFHYAEDKTVIGLNDRLEQLVEQLHNCRDNVIIGHLNELPILVPDAHTRPFRNARLNVAAGLFLPLGIFFFLRIWRYRLRLWYDMQQIQKHATSIRKRIINKHIAHERAS